MKKEEMVKREMQQEARERHFRMLVQKTLIKNCEVVSEITGEHEYRAECERTDSGEYYITIYKRNGEILCDANVAHTTADNLWGEIKHLVGNKQKIYIEKGNLLHFECKLSKVVEKAKVLQFPYKQKHEIEKEG